MIRRHSFSEASRKILHWFDPRGRMSRSAYVRLILHVMLMATALFCVTIWIAGTGFREVAFAILACIIMLWLATVAQTVRRLHDRNRTGWWLALNLALYALSFALADKAADAYPILVTLYALLTVVFFVWFVVETIALRGTPGSNHYGPDPDIGGRCPRVGQAADELAIKRLPPQAIWGAGAPDRSASG